MKHALVVDLPIAQYNAVLEPSKIVPTQCHAKFHYKDVQSTILTILVEKSDPMLSG